MQVAILGALELRDDDGTLLDVAGTRLRTLLVRLALDVDRPVSVGALVDAVWADDPPAEAANALQTLVSRLRRALGRAALIAQSPAGYRLAVDPDDVDAHRFQRLSREGTAALRSGDNAAARTLLRSALSLWRGAIDIESAALDDLRLSAQLDAAQTELALGAGGDVVAELESLAAAHPLHEGVAALLVTALAADGRQADALRCYERIRSELADELGVDPSAELQAVHLRVLRGEVAAPRPERRLTNLKAQLTSFVGRESEVTRVGDALRRYRLVTLVGPGGAGKTRLAAEAGARCADTVHDGVWLAELAPVTDAADVAQVVLGALGLRENNLLERRINRATTDASTRLLDVLQDKEAVLVLDNCEHLIDACAQLAGELLELCPHLRILATSREPLGIVGEQILAVPPLGQPVPGTPAAEALTYPAVTLFVDRAGAAAQGFDLDDASAIPVIEIVRRLDGLPLAIELAAARLRTLPLADIASRLDDRFRLLTGGSRTALPRHRTLRAVVEWSWDLLAPRERELMARLAVFPAGFTPDAATAVCADDAVAAHDVPDLVASLIDKSLLQRVGDGRRVRMLETIREFGVERLAADGQLTDARRRHADYFAALTAEAQPHLTQSDQLPYMRMLSTERENIIGALRFRCDDGDADGALTLALGLGWYSMLVGNHADVTSWMGEALATPGGSDPSLRVIGRALYAMNAVGTETEADVVDEQMGELTRIAEQLGGIDQEQHPIAAVLRSAAAFFSGDAAMTARYLDDGLSSPTPWVRAAARLFRSNMAENAGDMGAMRSDAEKALTEFRALGERWGLASTLRMVALGRSLDGDLDGAQLAYEEAFDLMHEMDSREDEAALLVRLADLQMRRGDKDAAREMILRARDSAEQTGGAIESVFTLSMLAELERQAGDLERARTLQHEAQRRIASMPAGHPAQSHGRTIVLGLGARLAFYDGDVAEAAELAHGAYIAAQVTKDRPIIALIGVVVADIVAGIGDPGEAAVILGAAARVRGADDRGSFDVVELTRSLTAVLGEEGFAENYQVGRALDVDAALARLDPTVALNVDQPPTTRDGN